MDARNRTHEVLMLRAWLGVVSGGDAFVHIEALPMRNDPDRSYGRYGDYSIFHGGDDARNTLHLDNFRFKCQIDGNRPASYAWSWGYQPDRGPIFTAEDLRRYAPSSQAVQKGMEKFGREDGPADSIGRLIVRLARILKLDGIAVLETSTSGSFRDAMEVCWTVIPAEYERGITWINDLESSLHRACAQRVGKQRNFLNARAQPSHTPDNPT